MRGAKGDGCLMKLKGCRLWYAQYYRDGKRYRVSTKTEVRAEAMAVLRKLTSDRDHGLAPLPEVRKLTYANLRAGLLANYEERGNRMVERADGTTTVMGLPQLDECFRLRLRPGASSSRCARQPEPETQSSIARSPVCAECSALRRKKGKFRACRSSEC